VKTIHVVGKNLKYNAEHSFPLKGPIRVVHEDGSFTDHHKVSGEGKWVIDYNPYEELQVAGEPVVVQLKVEGEVSYE